MDASTARRDGLPAWSFAIFLPGLTLLLFVEIFAAYAFMEASRRVARAIRHRSSRTGWWTPLLLRPSTIAAGLIAVAVPGIKRSC
jgi:uncharacterized membrane protein HdeD (DUF308 family)